jgi:hypothetical protein
MHFAMYLLTTHVRMLYTVEESCLTLIYVTPHPRYEDEQEFDAITEILPAKNIHLLVMATATNSNEASALQTNDFATGFTSKQVTLKSQSPSYNECPQSSHTL